MREITLRNGRAHMSFEVDVPEGETWTAPGSGKAERVTLMTVNMLAKDGVVSVDRVHVVLETGGAVGSWLPYGDLSPRLRAYITELDGALRAAPFTA